MKKKMVIIAVFGVLLGSIPLGFGQIWEAHEGNYPRSAVNRVQPRGYSSTQDEYGNMETQSKQFGPGHVAVKTAPNITYFEDFNAGYGAYRKFFPDEYPDYSAIDDENGSDADDTQAMGDAGFDDSIQGADVASFNEFINTASLDDWFQLYQWYQFWLALNEDWDDE